MRSELLNFQRLEEAFREHLDEGLDVGVAVAVYQDGKELCHFYGGERDQVLHLPWEKNTPVLVWSTGKGIAMACLLHVLQEHQISLEQSVASIWPEFGVAGKEKITLAELLSHRAGMAVLLEAGLDYEDHEAFAATLASQPPFWEDRQMHAYSPLTIGYLIDEIVRRTTGGESLADYWRRVFADPLELDIWFGVPDEKLAEVATIIPPRRGPKESPFSKAFNDPHSLTRRAFGVPGEGIPYRTMNESRYRQGSFISFGAIATADALAKFYSLIARFPNPFFDEERGRWIQEQQTQGLDQTLLVDQQFSAGFIINQKSQKFGPYPNAFGHAGSGGSVAFADPVTNIGFAYTPNAMSHDEERKDSLVQALFDVG